MSINTIKSYVCLH